MKNTITDHVVSGLFAALYLFSLLGWVLFLFKTLSLPNIDYSGYRDIVLGLVIIATNFFFAFFFLFRRSAKNIDRSKSSYLWAIFGTYIPLFFNFNHFNPSKIIDILIIAGLLLTAVSIFNLGKSIDVFASNRGIVTSGVYRYIRHPMYFSYLFLNSLYILLSPLYAWRLILFVLWTFCIYKRIQHEEKLLLQSDSYQNYTKHVKYRLIPYLW